MRALVNVLSALLPIIVLFLFEYFYGDVENQFDISRLMRVATKLPAYVACLFIFYAIRHFVRNLLRLDENYRRVRSGQGGAC